MSDVGGIGGTNGINGLGASALTGPQTAATALAALRARKVSTIEISDTVQNIARNLDALQAYAGKITALTTTDANQKLVVTDTQYQRDKTLLAVWGAGAGQTVGITAAKASHVGTLAAYVTSVVVADTSANIARYLDTLQTLTAAGTLTEIVQTGNPGNLTITSAQLTANQDALDKIKNRGYTLAITNASVSDVLGLDAQAALKDNAKIKSIAIVDTTDNIATNLDALQRVGLRIKSIAQTDAATPLEITGAQYKNDRTVLGKFITSDLLAVIDASASQMKALAADNKVVTVEIHDTASNISRNWALLEDLADSLTEVNVTDQATAIRLNASQLAASTTLLSKFTDTAGQTYKLQVTNVSSGTALAVASTHNVESVDVSDSAANIVANMADLKTLNDQGQLSSITQSGSRSPMLMDISLLQGAELTATQAVLDKLKGQNYTLAVAGLATADLADVTGNKRVVSITVADSSDNIEGALTTLNQLGSRLKGIDQSDSGTALDLSQSAMDANTTVLSKIAGGYTANLTGVTARKAATNALNSHVASMTVSDTGKNIVAHWAELRTIGANLDSVTQSDADAMKLSADNYQLGVHDGLVAKLVGSSEFSIANATVDQAQTLSADAAVTQIDVAAQGSVIVENLAALATLVAGGKVTSITNQTPTTSLALEESQLTDAQTVLDVIKGGSYTLAVSGVDVADAKDLLDGNSKIAKVAVSGVAADIVANLSDLSTLGRKLTTITQTDAPAETLEMTGLEFETNATALAKIEGGFLATLSDVGATKAVSYANNSSISSMTVADTGVNLASTWSSLTDLGDKLTGVTQNDASTLQLSASSWLQGQALRGKFDSDPVVSVSGAGVAQVADLATDDAVEAIQVTDSASALSAAIADLAAEAKITEVVVQDPAVALTLTGQAYADAATLLALVKNDDYTAELSEVLAQDVATLAADTHVTSMDVSDTSDEVSANFAALAAATNLNAIELSDVDGTVTLTADQILDDSSTLDKITGSYQLAATGVAMVDLSAIQDVPQTSSISISDTSDNVSANFADILALGDTITLIHLTDGSPVLSMSQQDWTAGTTALSTIDGSYEVDVTDTMAGDAGTVAADITVRNVTVADTASNVVNQWDALVALYDGGAGKLTAIALSDANPLVLSAAQQVAGADMITALLADETIQTAP